MRVLGYINAVSAPLDTLLQATKVFYSRTSEFIFANQTVITTMKKLLLLSLLFVAFAATTTLAQVPRRVLVEEFTNTGCPPCAISDPFMEEFQNTNIDKIIVLKFHTSGPDPSDPYYKANTKEANPRANYYSVTGVPTVQFDGVDGMNPTGGVTSIQNAMDNSVSNMESSPFEMSIVQELTTDSIIATITIKAIGDVPTESDLRLACVFAERFNKFKGNNGMPSYDYIVRKTLPGIDQTTGEITATSEYPNLSITKGETKTFRFAAKIPPYSKSTDWNRPQLYTASFIQGASSKTVYQSNWTVPSITVDPPASNVLIVPSTNPLVYTINNLSASAVTVNAAVVSTGIPSEWNMSLSGVDANGMVNVPANGSATVSLASTAASEISGAKPFSVSFTHNGEMHVGEPFSLAWGKGNKDIVVDAGGGTTNCNTIATAIKASDEAYANNTVVVSREDFESAFDSWEDFRTVMFIAGGSVGLYSDVGSWEKLEAYLNNGGHFLLSSTVCLNAYNNSANETLFDLWRTNFGIEPTAYDNSTGWGELLGVTNDPLSNGLSTTVSGISTTHEILPSSENTIGCFMNENNQVVGTRATISDGKCIYLSFGLNNVKTADRTSTVKRVMDWFAGVASVKISENASATTISNYPNPASLLTTFTYSLTERSLVTLSVYDVMGREVASIITNQMQDKGTYESDLDVSILSAGSYIYKLNVGGNMLTGTLNVVK